MKQKALPPRASGVLRCQWRQGQFGELLTPGLPLPDLIGKGFKMREEEETSYLRKVDTGGPGGNQDLR